MDKVKICCLECEMFVTPSDTMLTIEEQVFPLRGGYIKLPTPFYSTSCSICGNELVLHELNHVNIMVVNAISSYAKELVRNDSSFAHLWGFN
ncbi:hypothetical protein A4_102 [Escherichia phage A4]|nr:hypothetical protein [Escherichia coli]USL83769.1 hypothetical protein A4_102 [Escherichia phage A4]